MYTTSISVVPFTLEAMPVLYSFTVPPLFPHEALSTPCGRRGADLEREIDASTLEFNSLTSNTEASADTPQFHVPAPEHASAGSSPVCLAPWPKEWVVRHRRWEEVVQLLSQLRVWRPQLVCSLFLLDVGVDGLVGLSCCSACLLPTSSAVRVRVAPREAR